MRNTRDKRMTGKNIGCCKYFYAFTRFTAENDSPRQASGRWRFLNLNIRMWGERNGESSCKHTGVKDRAGRRDRWHQRETWEKKKKNMFVKGCWETISFTFKSFIEAVANIALIHKPWPKYHHTVCIFHGLHPCLNHELHLKLIIHHRKNTQSCWINERTQWKWQSDRG